MSGPREGYPRINSEDHPLWVAQQDGWPDHLPPEAWAEVARHADERRQISSAKHPAFLPGYLVNKQAEQPPETQAATAAVAQQKERR